jgi:hypothetical protein
MSIVLAGKLEAADMVLMQFPLTHVLPERVALEPTVWLSLCSPSLRRINPERK